MVERLKESVSVQKWIIILLLPLVLTIAGFTVNVVMASTNIKDRIEVNESHIEFNQKDIKDLEEVKTDKDDTDRNYDLLLKINDKIDNYIINGNF